MTRRQLTELISMITAKEHKEREQDRLRDEIRQEIDKRSPEEQARRRRIDDFYSDALGNGPRFDDLYRIGKTGRPASAVSNVEDLLACPYEDLKQTLEDAVVILSTLRLERDAEARLREHRRRLAHRRRLL